MKIVVIGGTGLIGSQVVRTLTARGHQAIAASPASGVNAVTGQGLTQALTSTDVVIDLANSPSFEDKAVLEFFERAGRNLKAAELEAGVKHHVALSIVGTDRLPESGYFRAKVAQEQIIRGSGVPYTIVHATQFCEFVPAIAESAAQGDTIRLPSAPLQPMAAEEVAAAVVEYALGEPRNGVVEIAGPEPIPLDQLVQRYLVAAKDPRRVVRDEQAGYFGAPLKANTLVPGPGAHLGKITFDAWLATKYA